MTNKQEPTQSEKLQALIQKAVEKGYRELPPESELLSYYPLGEYDYVEFLAPHLAKFALPMAHIIFSHDFAKALFGEEYTDIDGDDNLRPIPQGVNKKELGVYYWKIFEWHLQQAVISDNPIDYLYKAVFK